MFTCPSASSVDRHLCTGRYSSVNVSNRPQTGLLNQRQNVKLATTDREFGQGNIHSVLRSQFTRL